MSAGKKIEDGGPAFPQNLPDDFVWRLPGDPGGMSLRDWFAGQALSGIVATDAFDLSSESHQNGWARCAYQIADAMLKARLSCNVE